MMPDELYLVSLVCSFRTQPLSVASVATQVSTLLLIPPDVFNRGLETPGFRDQTLGLFAACMADPTGLIYTVAFQRLD